MSDIDAFTLFFCALFLAVCVWVILARGRGSGPAVRSTRVQPTPTRSAPAPPPRPDRPAAGSLTGRVHVIDGDTIVIGRQKIRLAGIDAPELHHPYGQKAKWAMVAICKGRTVTARPTGETSYDRVVAVCTSDDGADIGAELIKTGLALDWAQFSGGRYRHLEPPGARDRLLGSRRWAMHGRPA